MMSEERLNNVMLLHVHKDFCDNLDLLKVAKTFVSANSHRQGIFGHFTRQCFRCFFLLIVIFHAIKI